MTAQARERMVHEGQLVSMPTMPLENYFLMGGYRPRFALGSTARRRGYSGTWEIIDERLYLIALQGKLISGQEATLKDVFPNYPERVFAHWYSGEIHLLIGAWVGHINRGMGDRFEREIHIDVERGLIVSRREERNEADHAQ